MQPCRTGDTTGISGRLAASLPTFFVPQKSEVGGIYGEVVYVYRGTSTPRTPSRTHVQRLLRRPIKNNHDNRGDVVTPRTEGTWLRHFTASSIMQKQLILKSVLAMLA